MTMWQRIVRATVLAVKFFEFEDTDGPFPFLSELRNGLRLRQMRRAGFQDINK
jgi:hypothetical protein